MNVTLTPTRLIAAAAAGLLGLGGLAVAGALPGADRPSLPEQAEVTEAPPEQADAGLERAAERDGNAVRGDEDGTEALDLEAPEHGEPNENAGFGQSVAERAQSGEPQEDGRNFGRSVAEEASDGRSALGADAAEAGAGNAERAGEHRPEGAGAEGDGEPGSQAGDRKPVEPGKPDWAGEDGED